MATTTDDTRRPRFQPADVRRRQILDAAERLALEEGLEHTSIAQVAEAAGIAKGSIYLHFESRQALLAALQADVWQRMLERPLELAADDTRTWADRLDAVVEHLLRFEYDQQGLYHAVFHTIATDTEEPLIGARDLLGALIDGGVAAGEFDLDGLDRDSVLAFLLHGYVGPCFHARDRAVAISTAQLVFRRVLGAT